MNEQLNLSGQRLFGDAPADQLIEQLVQSEGIDYLRSLFPYFSDYKNLKTDHINPLIINFLSQNSNLPSIYDRKNMIRATDYYRKNQENIGLVLGLYSLPYCYLGADGARVLAFSERLNKDAYKRLIETGNFLKSVLNYDNWEENKIFIICLKVRLLHASIRYFILKSGRWEMSHGFPINQEDLLGTNLAFSLIVLRGMERLGHTSDDSEKRAFMNLWNVIGFLLGIKLENLPQNYMDAVKITKGISTRQFKFSPQGIQLTASLMNAFKTIAPNKFTADLIQEQCRLLLGNNYAEMLKIEKTSIPPSMLKVYNATSALMSKIF